MRSATELWGTCSSLKELYAKLTDSLPGPSEEALKKRLQLLNCHPSTATSPRVVRQSRNPAPAPAPAQTPATADEGVSDECKGWQ